MLRLEGAWTPIIFSTQEFLEAYEADIDAQCAEQKELVTERELISEVLQVMLERWDMSDERPISYEFSVGYLVGALHALFVPMLRYVNERGRVRFKCGLEEPSEPTTDPLPALTIPS